MTRILLATDDVGALVWGATAARLGVDVAAVILSADGVEDALEQGVDVVLLSGAGLGRPVAPLVAAVRAAAPDLAILAVPAPEEDARAASDAGADAVLHGLGDSENRETVLAQACTAARTRRALARTRLMADAAPRMDTDAGTTNLALARLMLDNLLARADRLAEGLSVLAIEADDADVVLAAHGPEARAAIDDELRTRIRECVREYDVVARIEGGGMLVVLYPCDAELASGVAGRLRRLSDERRMILGGQRVRLSCSVGVATWPAGAPRGDPETVIQRAAEALVDARLGGGGQVVLAPTPALAPAPERQTG